MSITGHTVITQAPGMGARAASTIRGHLTAMAVPVRGTDIAAIRRRPMAIAVTATTVERV
jgi:hypothetical protein